ncbi:BTAD domain-containing putative transcriptional regulator [Nocardia sp. NPDC088792]|uniref:BTAD domain-containing putative transcriptional regulator n=1 Tax=Nocardia sp. NPDC088792 TaxID=3364332 RepID=UPI0037F7754F
MQFGILGPVEVRRDDGGPVSVGGPQMRSLLALLVLEAGRGVGRERLIDGLYGEEPPGDAGHALQSQVSRLRRALRNGSGGGELVESTAAGYRLVIDPRDTDVHRFAELAERGRKALRDKDPATAATLLDEALGLWRGPALADVRDAPFAAAQAARLDEQRWAAEEDRAEAALAVGEHRAVPAALIALVADHPLRERARALLMRALYAAGRQAEALELFEQGRQVLADELGADPAAELTAAHLAILRAEEAAGPAIRRLPTPITSFVGRETELAQLLPLLAQARLVTLIGPGGTGKTRLAVEAGARARGEVCFADLATLVDGAQVAQAVAAALGGHDLATHSIAAHRDAETQVLSLLADRPMLLILDNCEHVILDAARLAHRMLLAHPGLRVLATSREALRITGETVFPLGQLPVASPDSALAEQLSSPAVRLFAERAAAASPGFTVDAGTVGMVGRLCARLDGLPLAIELAAARLRVLGLGELDARLTDRFRLLGRGDRTAEPRHRTLQAVVAWSWDLLDPAEQLLAQRFSVFTGGATVDDVIRVCELDDADELLPGLAEKSLVEVTAGRYRMLETIREFSAAKLAGSGDRERLHRAHARHFTTLAETIDPLLRTAGQLEALAAFTARHDNLQAALHWSARTDPALARRLIAAQSWYWWLSGRPGDAADLAAHLPDRAIADLGTHEKISRVIAPLGGEAATPSGPMPCSAAQPPAVLSTAEPSTFAPSAAVPSAAMPDKVRLASANSAAAEVDSVTEVEEFALCAAVAAWGGGDVRERVRVAAARVSASGTPLRRPHLVFLLALAGGLLEGGQEARERLFGNDAWSRGFVRLGEGLRLYMTGEPAAAEPEFRCALGEFRSVGDRWAIASVLEKLAAVAERQGDRAAALALIEEAIELNTEMGSVPDTADLLNRRGDILFGGAEGQRDLRAARDDYERAAGLSRSIGLTDMRANALRGLGDVARELGDEQAGTHYAAALAMADAGTIGAIEARARALIGLGLLELAAGNGNSESAASRFEAALEIAQGGGLRLLADEARRGLAAVTARSAEIPPDQP